MNETLLKLLLYGLEVVLAIVVFSGLICGILGIHNITKAMELARKDHPWYVYINPFFIFLPKNYTDEGQIYIKAALKNLAISALVVVLVFVVIVVIKLVE